MEMEIPLPYLIAVIITGYSAFTDLKEHKIYNKLTMPSIAAGILLNLVLEGMGGLKNSLLGFGLGVLSMILWILGMLKAGDVKLYMSVGAIAGWKFCGYTIIGSILTGGLISAFLIVFRGTAKASFMRIKLYILHLFYTREFHIYEPEESSAYCSFGSCIFCGVLESIWYLCFR